LQPKTNKIDDLMGLYSKYYLNFASTISNN